MGAWDSSSDGRGRGLRAGLESGLASASCPWTCFCLVLRGLGPPEAGGPPPAAAGAAGAGVEPGGPSWPISKCPRLSRVLLSVGFSDSAAQQGHGV